jgi:hypothetical protein
MAVVIKSASVASQKGLLKGSFSNATTPKIDGVD